MRRITEQEAWRTAGDEEPPVLGKVEHDATESAVTLKRWPAGFVLGISCDLDDRFELYAIDEEAEARAQFERHVEQMQTTGRPFFDGAAPVAIPHRELSPEALRGVVESFVLREGTDYGAHEFALEQKVAHVMGQLERGEAQILFDPESESVTLRRKQPTER